MYCLNCGTQLADTAKFCHACGTPTQKTAPPPPSPPQAATGWGTPPPPPPASPKEQGDGTRRLLGCGVALLGVLLLVGLGLLAIYFLLGLHRDSGITELAPDDAAAVVVIRPGLLQLNQLRDTDRLMGSAAALAPLIAVPGLPDFAFSVYDDYGEMLQNANINPSEDVLPWIGREVALAATDADTNAVVVAAAVRNETRANAFLADLREQLEDEGVEFDESNHGGVTITEIVGPDFYTPLAYAIADNRLVLASSREALEDALDRANGRGRTLSDNDAYHDAMAAQPRNRLGTVYIDPAALSTAPEFEALRWVAGSASLIGKGLRFGYRLGFDRNALDGAQRAWMEQGGIDNRMADRIPDDTMFYLAGGSLAETLENVASQAPDFEEALGEIQQDGELSGLYDLLEMMTGEFALAVSRDDTGLLAEMTGEPFGLLIVSQADDGDTAHEALDAVFDDIARQAGANYETNEIGNASVGFLDAPFIGPFLGYGVDGKAVILGTSEDLIEKALEPSDALADAPRFKDTMSALPGNGLLYFYLDADAIDRLINVLGIVSETSEDYTRRIEAIGLAVEPLDRGGEMNAELFFLTERPRR